jgi:hypothetical protein
MIGFYPLVPVGGRSSDGREEPYQSRGGTVTRFAFTGSAGVAPGSISGDVADPGNFQGCASRRKCGCHRFEIDQNAMQELGGLARAS